MGGGPPGRRRESSPQGRHGQWDDGAGWTDGGRGRRSDGGERTDGVQECRSDGGERTDDERGQTNVDLLIGVSVFVIAAGFVLLTASGMSEPAVGGQEIPLVADRTAALLAEGMFATAGTPGALDGTCTYGFFDGSMGEGTCAIPYNETESDLAARLGISPRYGVNVTIRRNMAGDPEPDVLCTDGGSVGVCPDTTRLAAGPTPPGSGSTFSAGRGVYLDGKDVVVRVVVW